MSRHRIDVSAQFRRPHGRSSRLKVDADMLSPGSHVAHAPQPYRVATGILSGDDIATTREITRRETIRSFSGSRREEIDVRARVIKWRNHPTRWWSEYDTMAIVAAAPASLAGNDHFAVARRHETIDRRRSCTYFSARSSWPKIETWSRPGGRTCDLHVVGAGRRGKSGPAGQIASTFCFAKSEFTGTSDEGSRHLLKDGCTLRSARARDHLEPEGAGQAGRDEDEHVRDRRGRRGRDAESTKSGGRADRVVQGVGCGRACPASPAESGTGRRDERRTARAASPSAGHLPCPGRIFVLGDVALAGVTQGAGRPARCHELPSPRAWLAMKGHGSSPPLR